MSESCTELVYDKHPRLVTRSAIVRVVAGPNLGQQRPLRRHRLGVGTAGDNSLVLADPLVSRRHLELQVQDCGYLARDLGSTNGTFFRGARIREAILGIGAEIQLGSTVLRLEKGEETSEKIEPVEGFGALIGNAPPMQVLYGVLAAVAPSDTTVLVEGESGTGKELVAAELHRQSARSAGPYAIVDCAGLTPSLIASELFGHERGAFTGADAAHEGPFERARGGTVFLDEVGELPVEVQATLLRVLDTKVIRRVGSSAPRPVDVRLVAATNRDLAAEVKARRFRQDLYYRLAVVRVVVPPLRKRRGDIAALARHFLWQAGCANPDGVLTPEVLTVLEGRRWPGNVRELRNVMERALLLQHGSSLPLGSVQQSISAEQTDRRAARRRPEAGAGGLLAALPPSFFSQPYKEAKRTLVDEFEGIYLRRLVELHGNNLYRIARSAGVDRQLIRRLLQKHGLGSAQP